MLRKIFKYIEPLWQNREHEISLRGSLAIAFSVHFMVILSSAVNKWSADKSFEGLSLVLTIEASLIVALLGLTAFQNVQDKKIEADKDSKTTDSKAQVKVAAINKNVKTDLSDLDPDIEVKNLKTI